MKGSEDFLDCLNAVSTIVANRSREAGAAVGFGNG